MLQRFTNSITEPIRRFYSSITNNSEGKSNLPESVRRWLLPESEAESWKMPDPQVYENQADLYRKLSYIGTAADMRAEACIDNDFDIEDANGEEIEGHPLEQLLYHPNPFDSRTEFLRGHFMWRIVTGNSYWFLNRANENAEPDEIWLLPPSKIIPVPDGRMGLRGYLYTPGDGSQIPLEPWEVIHFKSYNPFSRYLGLSVIESLAMTANGAIAAQEWNTRLFAENNARLPGILAFSDMINDTDWKKLKQEVSDSASKRNNMMLRGVGKGGVEWMQGAVSQREMEFLDGLDRSMREIYDRVAPGLYNMLTSNSSLANGETGMYTFIKWSVAPLLRETADKLTSVILPTYGEGQKATYEDVLPEDRELKLREIETFAKFHPIDEVRSEMYGNDPDPDPERGKLLASQVASKSAPKPEQPKQEIPEELKPFTPEQPEPDMQEDEELKADLARWKRKAIRVAGNVAEMQNFTNSKIPPELSANIRARLASCKSAADVAIVFDEVKPKGNESDIKRLALQLEKAIELNTKPKEKERS